MDGYRWCSKCKQFQPVERFSTDPGRGGLQRVCKDCANAYQKKWYAQNREAIALRKRALQHGITVEQYQEMFEAQEGRCAICGEEDPSSAGLNVDHCHTSGRVRSLLCGPCNRGLGQFRDDPHLLRLAASYLESHR